ncbi:Uncharacterized protein (Fragment) [Durusdinium trenchii]|uniref:Uncharacterized protein n=1 Tax=Durusdinium trenchii TaxID=1381693 RepID=A0ABP0KMH0_9DINO
MDWRKKTLEPEDVALPTSKRLKSSASLSWKTATLDGHVPVKASPATLSWKQVGLVDEEASSKPSGSNFVKDEKAEPRVVTLTSQIISYIPTEVKQTTKYSEAGKNSDRIAGLLQLPCKCSKRTCFQQFKFKEVKPLLNLWHVLADVSKISLLTALSHDLTESNTESPDDDSVLEEGRRRYSLCGKDVCFKAFAAVLGHSERTLLKYISGQPDLRRSNNSVMPRSKDQTMFCHMFFAELYQTAAEDLPEKPVLDKNCSIDDHIASAGQEEVSVNSVEYSKHFVWMLEAPIAELMSALLKCSECAHTRTLPPGEISDLWQQFLAWSQNQGVLTVIADSLDKGKCAYPKYDFSRVPADLDKLNRPRRRSWQSIGELQKVLEDALIQRGQHLKEKIMVKELKTVRDWSAWLDPLDVKLSNTFRGRKKRNEDEDPMITGHSFSYKRLGDLTQQERGKVRPRRDHSDDDVYCILKARMHHDASDAHAPVLVLPADRVNRVGPASSLHNIPQVELSGDRIKKLGLLVGLLKKYSYPIGATAIEELVNQKDEDLEVPLVTWLDEPGVARMHNLVFGGNQYWPHLPEVCFPLLAMMK